MTNVTPMPTSDSTWIGYDPWDSKGNPGPIRTALEYLGVSLSGTVVICCPRTLGFIDIGGTLIGLRNPLGWLARFLVRLAGFDYIDIRAALRANARITTATDVVAFGSKALMRMTTGSNNRFIGVQTHDAVAAIEAFARAALTK